MGTDHVKMLCDIGELNGLFEQGSIEDILQKTVEMVAEHMQAEVCSIYIYNESTKMLELKANVGLKNESVDMVRMKCGEGIVGTALKEMRPICEKCGEDNPNYKFYPGIDEELYRSFLAVPITRGNQRIGVLSVQRNEENYFVEQDVLAMRATASQLASMLESVKCILDVSMETLPPILDASKFDFTRFNFIKGKSASPGSVLSRVAVFRKNTDFEILTKINKDRVLDINDLMRALENTEKQLEDLQEKVEQKLSDAASLIFASHLVMLKDRGFIGGIRELVEKGENPALAVYKVFTKYKNIFSQSPSSIIREKVEDIKDLSLRLINNILYSESEEDMTANHVIIARELFPSDILKLSAEEVSGIILVSGGVTSHLSILARSLGIPLVFIDDPGLLSVPAGTDVLLDADIGNVYFNPSRDVIQKFEEKQRAAENLKKHDVFLLGPAKTRDGDRINLMININLLSDVRQHGLEGIDGVGLYRTEFPFMIRNNFPSEEEQFVIYEKLLSYMDGKPVAFRTLDIGGDKILSYYDHAKEENPFLGMRSIRFSLRHEEIFKQQIRALLRAGSGKNMKIMFPMISSVDEFTLCREILKSSIKELKKENIPHNNSPEVGLMIEIPSAINILDDLAKEADFFSIGTNDLVQYTLAVDRTNEKVSDLYIPHHPSVLRSLKKIADSAIKAKIDVSVCGDMGSNRKYIPFLIGIGIKSLSVDSVYLPDVKQIISGIDASEAAVVAEKMLSCSRISEVEEILDKD